jgi:hypothetical protein
MKTKTMRAKRHNTHALKTWKLFVREVQYMFTTRYIPDKANWAYLVIIPKPNGGTGGIGLLKVIWKIIKAIIKEWVTEKVKLHDILHGFCKHRGKGIAIIEAKLQQELANIQGNPLYQVFLDLNQAYDTLHRKRALQTLQ